MLAKAAIFMCSINSLQKRFIARRLALELNTVKRFSHTFWGYVEGTAAVGVKSVRTLADRLRCGRRRNAKFGREGVLKISLRGPAGDFLVESLPPPPMMNGRVFLY